MTVPSSVEGVLPCSQHLGTERNIHVPALIAQFEMGRPTIIRRVRMDVSKDSMPREKCHSTPGQAPLTSIPTFQFSGKFPANIVTAFGDAYFHLVAKEVTRILTEKSLHPTPEFIACYESLHSLSPVPEEEEESKEKRRSHQGRVDPPAKSKDHQNNNYHILGRNISKWGQSHHYRELYICVTEEVLLAWALLTNPVLDNIANLGYITYHMGTNSSGPSDPPWFKRPDSTTILRVIITDENNQEFKLSYLRYCLSNGEPVILGTTERDGPVYEGNLAALPARGVLDDPLIDNTDLKELYLDYPFNWAINIAIFRLGDPGVMANMYRFRASYTKLKALKNENERILCLVEAFQEEQTKHTKTIKDFADGIEALKNRLVKAKVRTQLLPHIQNLIQENAVSTSHYPYNMMPQVIEPALQVVPPELPLMRCPPTLRPVIPIFIEPSSSGDKYVSVSPTTESDISPWVGGIPVSSPSVVDKGAQVANYSAGNSHRPHHQPTPFDTEQAPAWVIPPSPHWYPSETASLRPPHKQSVSTANYEGTTAWNATLPMTAAPEVATASPSALTPTSVESAKPATSPADRAEASKADLLVFCSPTTRMWDNPSPRTTLTMGHRTPTNCSATASSFALILQLRHTPPHIGTASNYRPPLLPSLHRQMSLPDPLFSPESPSKIPAFLLNGKEEKDWSMEVWKSPSIMGIMLHPLKDKAREELDKLLHADDIILMRLLCIEFDSELLFVAACSTWLHSVTRLEYIIDPTLFPY